jgi:hypothetical protein
MMTGEVELERVVQRGGVSVCHSLTTEFGTHSNGQMVVS